jgi:hypothetical protein
VQILRNHLGSDRVVEGTVLKEGIDGQLSALRVLVQQPKIRNITPM